MLADVAELRRRVRARRRVQYSLRGLLSAVFWASLVCGLPGMLGLVLLIVGWLVPAVLVLGALVLVQLPFYLAWKLLVPVAELTDPETAP